MSIKITCDICGKEITDFSNGGVFDDFQFCDKCFKRLEGRRAEWRQAKRKLFLQMFDKEIAQSMEKNVNTLNKRKPAKHAHVCQCAKDGKKVVTTVPKGKSKRHDHWFVTTRELADAIGAKVHTVQCYANRKGLGTIDAKTRVRVYDEKAAEAIRRHFDAK